MSIGAGIQSTLRRWAEIFIASHHTPSRARRIVRRSACSCKSSSPLAVTRRRQLPYHRSRPFFLSSLSGPFNETPYDSLSSSDDMETHSNRKSLKLDNPVFISKHFKFPDQFCLSWLERENIEYRRSGENVVVKYCPTCPPHKNAPDNLWKLYVFLDNGNCYCHRCGLNCSWFDLLRHANKLPDPPRMMTHANERSGQTRSSSAVPNQNEAEKMRAALLQDQSTLRYLNEKRGIKLNTLKKYGVGVTDASFLLKDTPKVYEKHRCITFPWTRLSEAGALLVDRLKLRAVECKRFQRLSPSNGCFGFFGWHTVPASETKVVITEGEFDAMAVYQETGFAAISLPNGARSLPVELLPCLERFKKIILWLDDDVPGQEGVESFSKKLGFGRCFSVRSRDCATNGPKDANDALLAGVDLTQLIRKAKCRKHDQIASLPDLREDIVRELLDDKESEGVQMKMLPSLQNLLKGHRAGELTIMTGPTGLGKTTVLAQISLDLCLQGVRTLWGSFEVKLPRLCKTLLSQFANGPIEEAEPQDLHLWLDSFETMPMYMMRFHGDTKVDSAIDAMQYAVYASDVQHIVLDNLQFMLGSSGHGATKFDHQDSAISSFRQFATKFNVHITLVIHPRKEPDGQLLGINSVFGSGKATQEADNVIIMQPHPPCVDVRFISVQKNRYDGATGRFPYRFDRGSRRILELDNMEKEQLRCIDTEFHNGSQQKRNLHPSTQSSILPAPPQPCSLNTSLPSDRTPDNTPASSDSSSSSSDHTPDNTPASSGSSSSSSDHTPDNTPASSGSSSSDHAPDNAPASSDSSSSPSSSSAASSDAPITASSSLSATSESSIIDKSSSHANAASTLDSHLPTTSACVTSDKRSIHETSPCISKRSNSSYTVVAACDAANSTSDSLTSASTHAVKATDAKSSPHNHSPSDHSTTKTPGPAKADVGPTDEWLYPTKKMRELHATRKDDPLPGYLETPFANNYVYE